MEHDATNSIIEQPTLQDAYRQKWEREAALRRRERRKRIIIAAIGMMATFGLGFLWGTDIGSREPTPSAPAVSAAPPEETRMPSPEHSGDKPIATPPPNTSPDPAIPETAAPLPPVAPILDSVPLDAETQLSIYGLCDGDQDLFCAMMAIAKTESNFNADAVGDGGNSIGMMQINIPNHAGRISDLGVADMTDPVQCATVAIDYMRELSSRYGFGWVDGHAIYMAFNMGPGGAQKAIQNGETSSTYSQIVLGYYEGYQAEIGGQE